MWTNLTTTTLLCVHSTWRKRERRGVIPPETAQVQRVIVIARRPGIQSEFYTIRFRRRIGGLRFLIITRKTKDETNHYRQTGSSMTGYINWGDVLSFHNQIIDDYIWTTVAVVSRCFWPRNKQKSADWPTGNNTIISLRGKISKIKQYWNFKMIVKSVGNLSCTRERYLISLHWQRFLIC